MTSFLQQSTAMLGTLRKAVMGNPVLREYNVGELTATFGPGLLWKVYNGTKKSTGQEVSLFILEKSSLERFDRREKEFILEKMKHGPQQLTKLRHPRVLTVQHPLEDSRDSLVFATEPVFGSLSNILGNSDNLPSPLPKHLQGFELYAVEKVYGLLQLAEGISFLHNDANLSEGNLTTDNIVLTKSGMWKLAGFHFSNPKQFQIKSEYTTSIPRWARPDLDYLAPEYLLRNPSEDYVDLSCADMFSFACVVSAVYNQLKTPLQAGECIASYKKALEKLTREGSDQLRNIPSNLRDHVILLLNPTSNVRPDATQTIAHTFFDDISAMTLKYLDSLVQRDDMAKSQFFKSLPRVLEKLPLRVIYQRILPPLFAETANHMMVPFILTNVFIVVKMASNEEYTTHIFPNLKQTFQINNPVQVLLILMQNIELMIKKTSSEDVKIHVLPLVFKALESPTPQLQDLVLTIIPNIAHLIDYGSLKNSIIPRLKVLITKTNSISVRVNSLVCLGKIIGHMDKFLLVDEIFPMFLQIPSRDPAVLMAILGVYKQTLLDKKISLEKDYLATKALPCLLPMVVEPTLNVQQFNQFMSVIREMMDRVEQEHRMKLEQLTNMQQQHNTSTEMGEKSANKSCTPSPEEDLSKILGIKTAKTTPSTSLMSSKGLNQSNGPKLTINQSNANALSNMNQSKMSSLPFGQSNTRPLIINQSSGGQLSSVDQSIARLTNVNQSQLSMNPKISSNVIAPQNTPIHPSTIPIHSSTTPMRPQKDFSCLDNVGSSEMQAFKSRQPTPALNHMNSAFGNSPHIISQMTNQNIRMSSNYTQPTNQMRQMSANQMPQISTNQMPQMSTNQIGGILQPHQSGHVALASSNNQPLSTKDIDDLLL